MSKATHTGTTKDLYILINQWDEKQTPRTLSFLTEIAGHEVKLSKEFNNRFSVLGYDSLYLGKEDLTDIQPIKPEIEIPETPFIIDTMGGKNTLVSIGNKYGIKYIDSEGYNIFTADKVSIFLNNGTWTLCDKPEISIPEMPFFIKTEINEIVEVGKDFSGFFISFCDDKVIGNLGLEEVLDNLNNGLWTICPAPEKKTRPYTDEELIEYLRKEGWFINSIGQSFTPLCIDNKKKEVHFLDEDPSMAYEPFSEIIEKYTDIHENPFTKEI